MFFEKSVGFVRKPLVSKPFFVSNSFDLLFINVRRTCGPPLTSSTGFAEGCPLSCVAMCVVGHMWHRWQALHMPRCLPLSYVDNLELISADTADLLSGISALRSFCSALDVSIDEACLYVWSTSSIGRRHLVSQGFKLSRGARDLGGQVDYTAKLHNKVLTNRIEESLHWYLALRASRMPTAVKVANITQVLFPRGLHGCEAVVIGSAHVQRLRAHVMKALRWDRAGSSPVIRISLLHSHLDPEWYQTWHCLQQFRRQCQQNEAITDWWKMFCQGSRRSFNGPFSKLVKQLTDLQLELDGDGRLWFSPNGYIHVLNASEALVRQIVLSAYHDAQITQIQHREDYADLVGCDVELTQSHDAGLLPNELEYINIARDGAFVADFQRSKFDGSKSHLCPVCGVRNDVSHKYRECTIYEDLRIQHAGLVSQWATLPDGFVLHGLVPANPWKSLLWEAFVSLEDTTSVFAFGPSGGTQHLFTDGSCSNPTTPSESLAGWAVHHPDKGTVSCGHLIGIQQCIARAELTALLSALLWGADFFGALHIWSDNLNIVNHARALLLKAALPQDFEHTDLWERVRDVLGAATASIYFHKVPAHDDESACLSPYEDWCRIHNAKADFQAGLINLQRPLHFERIWSGYIAYRQQWKELVQSQVAFQLAAAKFDTARKSEQSQQVESDEEDCDVQYTHEPNQALLAVQIQERHGVEISFSDHHLPLFRKVCVQLRNWILDVDSEALSMRPVALLELYVMFRVGAFSSYPLLADGRRPGPFQVFTFAVDFSFFKKVWRHLASWANFEWTSCHISLRHLNILNPQPAVWIGWDFTKEASKLLKDFVGNRPIQSAQALSRPWTL